MPRDFLVLLRYALLQVLVEKLGLQQQGPHTLIAPPAKLLLLEPPIVQVLPHLNMQFEQYQLDELYSWVDGLDLSKPKR